MVKVIPRDPMMYYIYYAYMTIAIFGILTNAIFLVVCICFKKLRTSYRLYIAIAFGDSILSFAFLATGFRRSTELGAENGNVAFKSASTCARELNVALLTLGSIFPAFLRLYMGSDRFLSVKFRQLWNKLRIRQSFVIAIIFLFSLGSLFVGVVYGSLFLKQKDTPVCSYSGAYGNVFGGFVTMSTIFCHVTGFLLTVWAWLLVRKATRAQNPQWKEKMMTKLSLWSTAACVLLVAIPNGGLFSMRYGGSSPMLAGSLYSAFCFQSSLNLFIFGLMNKDFRKCAIWKCWTTVIDVRTMTAPYTCSTTVEGQNSAQQRNPQQNSITSA